MRSPTPEDSAPSQTGLPATRQLELVSARPLRNGAVAMYYRRAG